MVWMMLAERKELQGKLSHADKVLPLFGEEKVLLLSQTGKALPLS